MAKSKKSPGQSPAPARMEAQEHGGILRRGGTNRGGPGRPPDLFKQLCRTALHDVAFLEVLKEIISGDIHELVGRDRDGDPIYAETRNRDRIAAIQFLADRGYGKATQLVGGDPDAPLEGNLTVRFVKGAGKRR